MAKLSDVEYIPDFLLDSTKIHAWVDGSETRGQAGFGVYFPHAEYDNVSSGTANQSQGRSINSQGSKM